MSGISLESNSPCIEASWMKALGDEFQKPYMQQLRTFLRHEKDAKKMRIASGDSSNAVGRIFFVKLLRYASRESVSNDFLYFSKVDVLFCLRDVANIEKE